MKLNKHSGRPGKFSLPFLKSKTITLWIISYMLLFAILMTNTIINNIISRSYIKKTTQQYNDMIFSNIRRNSEDVLSDFRDMYSVLLSSGNTNVLLNITDPDKYYGPSINILLNEINR